jgi:tetratricopeptide (TPR) repeat protein
VLGNLPPDADLFVSGDIATHTLGYLRYVEGMRPDVTVYSLAGAVFSNRLFDPLKTTADDELRLIEQHVARSSHPICTTSTLAPEIPQRDYWLFSCMARGDTPAAYAIALNDDLLSYLARVVAAEEDADAWAAYHHEQLIKRAGALLGKSESMGIGMAGEPQQAFADVRRRFFGTLGYVEGLTFFPEGRQRMRDIVDAINAVTRLPADAPKPDRARFMAVRGKVHARMGEPARAIEEFETSLSIWPDPRNESIRNLLRMYREAGEGEKRRKLSLRFPSVAETPAWTPRE